jgi:hypothetical protein
MMQRCVIVTRGRPERQPQELLSLHVPLALLAQGVLRIGQRDAQNIYFSLQFLNLHVAASGCSRGRMRRAAATPAVSVHVVER